MLARCRLELGDAETYATDFGLWIFELRRIETFTGLSQTSPNGLYHTLSSLVCGFVETQITVLRAMNRVTPDIGINDNTSSIAKQNPDLQCSMYYVRSIAL